ncbi:MAG TPA: hypothetical protein VFB15_04225 [Candidatus Binataceae bacterium]|nr:hypothetical protein [Candidatus Binataceae bacterium]
MASAPHPDCARASDGSGALRRWRTRLEPAAILGAALVVGAWLRFANLGTPDLSADEAASWAAASAQNVAEVLQRQAGLNPGELGVHDLLLHAWIRLFGDGLSTMRALSAVVATLAIPLVFLLVRAILTLADSAMDAPLPSDESADTTPIAAVAALLFAVNLVTIKYAREARMYPVALVLTLAQICCFLRALRSGGLLNQGLTALFTALAVASTYSTGLILVPEGLYLGLTLLRTRHRVATIMRLGTALVLGTIAVVPLYFFEHHRGAAPNLQTWDWIKPPAPWAFISLFNKGTGTYGFPLLAILAAAGAIRGWAQWRNGITLLLLWMFAPPVLLIIASYLFHPAFVERYVLSCFVPFFALAAIGLARLEPASMRPAAGALVVVISLAHVVAWGRKPHGDGWADATTVAARHLSPAESIGVAPHYAKAVVSYYLRANPTAPRVEASNASPPPTVIIVADSFDKPEAVSLLRQYPRVLGHPQGLTVRGR